MLINASHIDKSYGTQDILSNASLQVRGREKIGLVGRNGCGKTTLLKIISGQETPDAGNVISSADTTVGYLAQITFDDQSISVYEELLKAFEHTRQIEQELQKLAESLSQDSSEKQLNRYAFLQERFEALNGYNYDVELRNVFFHFSFSEADLQRPLNEFSSGQRTRIALVKLLLTKPDVLLLDEPTNHLDVESIEWLENYVKSYPFAVVLVSHDRMFLDHVVDEIVEIEYGTTMRFPGNYSHYVLAKKEYIEKNQEAYTRQQKEIERLQTLIEKFGHKASKASFAKSKQKYLDRMDKVEQVQVDHSQMKASFSSARKGGKLVLETNDLSVGYDKPLSNVSFELRHGQRMAVVGPNGIGKSTLMKTLMKKIPSLSGDFRWGHQIDVGYFDQDVAQMVSSNTVLDELWQHDVDATQTQIRNTLARFLFTQDEVFKEVSNLSGGEKVRLALACLMLEHDNVLLLDEPTNHLDIPAKEALEDALKNYDGTLLFVSHDRMFLSKMATSVLDMEQSKVYNVDYQSYVQGQIPQESVSKSMPTESKVVHKDMKALKNRVAKLETLLAKAEEELEELREKRFEPEYYQDFQKMETLNDAIDDKHNEIENLMQEWEEKMTQLES